MEPNHLTRRDVLHGALSGLIVSAVPAAAQGRSPAMRAINVMNFIRAEEPRQPMDLMLPVREQMRAIKANKLPATWLLQYDAMVEGPFVEFLKQEMPADHEAGLWFEMNRRHCDAAGIAWRGRPDWEWDYHVPVAYAIGYSPDERRRLADTAVATFRKTFNRDLKSVASWNLDAVSVAHFAEHHGVAAFGNCRDQLATDGFTIWGAPIAGYYPCRNNAFSPATAKQAQIHAPIFRLLGQDPVYYYNKPLSYPDTMEPVWASGRNNTFIARFLDMIAHQPTQQFAYAQLGQENSFGWPEMQPAYDKQMQALAELRKQGAVRVETMGETGRRFQAAFPVTPPQAQVMLQDPFGRSDPGERTIWYQSRFYRANLHLRGNEFYVRDLHVYNDKFEQPYMHDTVKEHGIEQRLLATLDGYHWSDGKIGTRAKGRFVIVDAAGNEKELKAQGTPRILDQQNGLHAQIEVEGGGVVQFDWTEEHMEVRAHNLPGTLRLIFEWSPEKTSFVGLRQKVMTYRFRDFDYQMAVNQGIAKQTQHGASVIAVNRLLRFAMRQR